MIKLTHRADGVVELADMPTEAATTLAAIDHSSRAARAMGRLIVGDGVDAVAVAREISELFSATADLLELGARGHHLGLSPDTLDRARALVDRVRSSATERRTLDRRARTYLEKRIILQAQRCAGDGSTPTVAQAVANVIGLTQLDTDSFWLADKVAKSETELAACVLAAIARKPRKGRFPPTGTRATKTIAAYERAFSALCRGIGIPGASSISRASERSRTG